ncbi:MAG TPA: JAB domain-containing protein [Erythrobacter sp.]|nr:JAB domain-containing protein [Erythrobacter sp.]
MLTLARTALRPPEPDDRSAALVDYLRATVLTPPALHERGHAIFVDAHGACLGEAAFGMGAMSKLTVRMRALFGEALRVNAAGMILAHNHPSGKCHPSACDIDATRRLQEVAQALDIRLIDHLIFTTRDVYSMRAGGML